MKKVSFIIPHKGREEFLQQTVASIFSLDFDHLQIEVIVVTQNEQLTSLVEFEQQAIDLTVLYQPSNITISALRNHGAKQAQGQYLAFLDADVALSANWLTAMLNLLESKKERLLVSAMQINGEAPPPLEQIRTVLSNAEIDCNVNFLPGRNLLLSRHTFDQVQGFPEHLVTCEDYYFTDKVHELGELYYSSDATYVHIGEDKDYSQMYHKEIWRGQSNLQSIKGRSIPLREWPSFLIPIGMLGLSLLSIIFLLLGQFSLALTSVLLTLFPVSLYSLRLFSIAKQQIKLTYILKFYAMYFPARAIGTVAGIFKSITIKEAK
ncbi:glycosyltransferase [Thalassotalea agariperforans]